MTQGEARDLPRPLAVAPAPPRIEITFDYTFDELREGLTQTPEFHQQQQKRKKWGPLSWVLFVALAVLFFTLMNLRALMPAPAPAPAPVTTPSLPSADVDVIVAVGPSALAASIVGVFLTLIAMAVWMMSHKDEQVRATGRQLPTVAVFAALLIAGVGAAVIFWRVDESDWVVSRGYALVLSLAPWVALVALGVAVATWLVRINLRRQWESKPYLRRRRTVVLDEQGERATDGIADLFYRWPYFRRAWETERCLVLLDENDLRHILPKRAMDQATLDLARAVISNHVSDCKFLTAPGGFPVATPAALPAASAPSGDNAPG